MPRIKSPPRKCIKSRNGQSKTWVVMMEDNGVADGTADIIKLKHPRSEQTAMFIFSSDNTSVQEVFSFKEKKRSWFIDDSVKEDGQLHLSTPVDPVFLVLPYLKRSKTEGRVLPLNDLLMDQSYPDTIRLLNCSGLNSLHQIADRKGDDELNAWMYNEEKTLRWLCRKAEKVAEVLKDKQVNVTDAAFSSSFVTSNNEDLNDNGTYLKYAHGLVAEYLPDDLAEKLRAALNLPPDVKSNNETLKRKPSVEGKSETSKKPKTEVQAVLDLSQSLPTAAAAKPMSSKDRSRIKAASGSKQITSFFKKK